MIILFYLLVAHALADFPLQGNFLSEAKNKNTPIGSKIWGWCLFYHGLIHGGLVALITGSFTLGIAELIVHCLIDYLKCENKINFHVDQILHILFKVLWVILII